MDVWEKCIDKKSSAVKLKAVPTTSGCIKRLYEQKKSQKTFREFVTEIVQHTWADATAGRYRWFQDSAYRRRIAWCWREVCRGPEWRRAVLRSNSSPTSAPQPRAHHYSCTIYTLSVHFAECRIMLCKLIAESTNIFKTRLDKFRSSQEIIYDYHAEIQGTGSRSVVN